MKKLGKALPFLLLVLLLSGCNSEKLNELSANSFSNLQSSHAEVETISAQVQEIWKLSMNTKHKYELDKSFDYFMQKTPIDEPKICAALANIEYAHRTNDLLGIDYYQEQAAKDPSVYYRRVHKRYNYNDLYKALILITVEVYRADGTLAHIEEMFTAAGESLKEISRLDSDYEHYESLKKYYSLVRSYYDKLLSIDEMSHDLEHYSLAESENLYKAYENELRELEDEIQKCYHSLSIYFE